MNTMNQDTSSIWKIKFRMCKVKLQNFLLEKNKTESFNIDWFKQSFFKNLQNPTCREKKERKHQHTLC